MYSRSLLASQIYGVKELRFNYQLILDDPRMLTELWTYADCTSLSSCLSGSPTVVHSRNSGRAHHFVLHILLFCRLCHEHRTPNLAPSGIVNANKPRVPWFHLSCPKSLNVNFKIDWVRREQNQNIITRSQKSIPKSKEMQYEFVNNLIASAPAGQNPFKWGIQTIGEISFPPVPESTFDILIFFMVVHGAIILGASFVILFPLMSRPEMKKKHLWMWHKCYIGSTGEHCLCDDSTSHGRSAHLCGMVFFFSSMDV